MMILAFRALVQAKSCIRIVGQPKTGPGRLLPVCPFERSRFAADAIACPEGRDIGDSRLGVLQNGLPRVHDEAIVSLSFLVSSMNSDSKIVPQALCLSTTSKPKSIEIPERPPRTQRL